MRSIINILIICLMMLFLAYFNFSSARTMPNSISDFGPFGSAMQIMPGDSNANPSWWAGTNCGKQGDVYENLAGHQEMGFSWDRTNIAWGSVEYPRGTYHWAEIDQRLEKIMDAGINPSLLIYGGNNYNGKIYWDDCLPGYECFIWQACGDDEGIWGSSAGTQTEYLNFVKKVVERYDGDGWADADFIKNKDYQIKFYEGWNEPDTFTRVDIGTAVSFHNQYYNAVKSQCSDCFVSSPGFAHQINSEEFINQGGKFDIMSLHEYYVTKSDRAANWDDEFLNKLKGQDSRLGLNGKPFWISEFADKVNAQDLNNTEGLNQYAFRTARVYVVSRYAMLQPNINLKMITEFPEEGAAHKLMDLNTGQLRVPGRAIKTVLSFLQNPRINSASTIDIGENGRAYRFGRSDGLNTYVFWALEGERISYHLELDGDRVRLSDFLGNEQTKTTSYLSLDIRQEPVFIEEVSSQPPTCQELKGDICQENETCSGSWLSVSDASKCCSQSCELPPRGPDINQDGKVDIQDLGILMSNWNKTDLGLADINLDRIVNLDDFVIIKDNWSL